jgi:polyhydroxybutyrate depolymerase
MLEMPFKRRTSVILAAILILTLGGCGRVTHADYPAATTGTITVGGTERTYLFHVPASYQAAQPAPLLIALHGLGETGGDMADMTGFDTLADAQGFIVVYPVGVEQSWADRNNTAADRAGVDDVAFIDALIDHLATSYAIDPARIYATGISNGGFMATLLACALPEKIAAVAPVAATMPVSLAPQCPATRPVPFLLIHGLDDRTVPPGGGVVDAQGGNLGLVMSDTDAITFWANHNGCAPEPTVTSLPTTVGDGTHVAETSYTGCTADAGVVYDALAGVGHVWPGGPHNLSQNFDASAAIWTFFAAHPRPDAIATP